MPEAYADQTQTSAHQRRMAACDRSSRLRRAEWTARAMLVGVGDGVDRGRLD